MLRTEPAVHSLSPRALAIAGWIAFLVAGTTFIAVAWNVSARDPIVQLDAAIIEWLVPRRTTGLTSVMMLLTHAHSIAAMSAWSVALALVLWRLRQRYWILTLAAAMAGGMALNWWFKVTYERARPVLEDPLLTLQTFSFPSGHTAAATLFYGVLAAFLVSRVRAPRWRAAIVAAAVVMVSAVAFSRVYLGAHFMSDVVAATCSSTVWLVLCLAAGHHLARRAMARA